MEDPHRSFGHEILGVKRRRNPVKPTNRELSSAGYAGFEDDQDFWRGAHSISIFLTFWLTSITLPFFGLFCIYQRIWIMILMIAMASYHSLTVKTDHDVKAWFAHGFRVYWRRATIRWEANPARSLCSETPSLLAVYPHGAFCMGYSRLFTQPELRQVHWCYADFLYRSSIFRAFTEYTGRPASARKQYFLSLMKRRQTIAILPGGFEEAAISCVSVDRVYLGQRKGWVKYALQHGYSITPVFTFGEHQTYATLDVLAPLRLWLGRTFGMAGTLLSMLLVFPVGLWWCPILPRDVGLHTVIAAPVAPPSIASATGEASDDEVDAFHARFVEALVALYDRHKEEFYGQTGARKQLEVW